MTCSAKLTAETVTGRPGEFDFAVDVTALKPQLDRFGFCGAHAAIGAAALARLTSDATRSLTSAKHAAQEDEAALSYRAAISGFGPYMKRYMQSPEVSDLLSALFGEDFALTPDRSCVTRYGAGDHLGAHRDEPREECDVTVIAYLDVVAGDADAPPEQHPRLNVYGRKKPQPSDAPALVIPSRPGTVAIGRGSRIWHERPRLAPGQRVIALTGCFHVLQT